MESDRCHFSRKVCQIVKAKVKKKIGTGRSACGFSYHNEKLLPASDPEKSHSKKMKGTLFKDH